MKLLESGEDYLETILVLQKQEDKVRSIDIANALKVSKASVCVAMKNLKKGGYIHMGDDHVITLTEEGQRLAESIYERHVLFSEVLSKLGVDRETAKKDACRMEHVLSEDSFKVLKKYFSQNGIPSENRE
ncbi:MAG TPA: metal-dependent transcriptional regulator [Candidatus Anaerostipes avistercoris]|uniref:Metal-dependent transcriptional regulator n=1 Tax=Candidatus Anaerostipes avistercoris TaxID=2838462 RepID=A0A9D2PKA8_9FIRM|nr:metal-dependent transcriptional regulator [Candidatus Anaerostipes avistercoris]